MSLKVLEMEDMEKERMEGRDDSGKGAHLLLNGENIRRGLQNAANPIEYIKRLQKEHGGVKLNECKMVLPFLALFDIKPEEFYRTLLKSLVKAMIEKIPNQRKEVLTRLLYKTLPFIKVQELEQIPRKLFDNHPDTPLPVLKALGTMDKQVISTLPKLTRQRMWERYRESFEEHVIPLIEAYRNDYGVMSSRCEMHPIRLSIPRKRRARQKVLQDLVSSVGSSIILYQHVVNIIRDKFLETNDLSLCALRADLLMSLHDLGVHEITRADPCHQLTWYLDAYTKQLWLKLANGSIPLKEATRGLPEILRELEKISSGKTQNTSLRHGLSKTVHGQILSNVVTQPKQENTFISLVLDAIKKLKREDRAKLFHRPVVETWPALIHSYPIKGVKNPMDLGTIETKIERGMYVTVDEVRKDLSLIAENAATFNGPNNEITLLADNIMNKKAKDILENVEKSLAKAKDETIEMRRRRQAIAEEQRKLQKKMEKAEIKRRKEEKKRQRQALSDAALILSSGFAMNALCCSLWLALDSEVIKQEALPRDANTVKDLCWLLQVGSEASNLISLSVDGIQTHLEALSFEFKAQILPILAQMQIDGIEYRTVKIGSEEELGFEEIPSRLYDVCGKSKAMLHLVSYFVCSRVRIRDYGAAVHYLKEMQKLGESALEYDPFLHSLCTAFHLSSIPQHLFKNPITTVTPMSGRKRPFSANNTHMHMYPQLPPSLRVQVIQWFYLPAIYRAASKGENNLAGLALAQAHFARFVTLESSIKVIASFDILNFCKRAFASLALLPEERPLDRILEDQELHAAFLKRYVTPEFKRAKRYYDKLFERFPTFRSQCGIPSNKELVHKYGAVMSMTPNPTPSPSPLPSPSTESPFPGVFSSPMTSEVPATPDRKAEGEGVAVRLMPFQETSSASEQKPE